MSTPVKIVVTAETAQAAAALQQFVAQGSSGLKTLAETGVLSAGKLASLKAATYDIAAASQGWNRSLLGTAGGLDAVGHSAFNSRMGLMELGHTARSTFDIMLMGGGAMGNRMMLAQLPQIAQGLSLMGIPLATVGMGFAALVPTILSATEALKAHRAALEADASAASFSAETQTNLAKAYDALNKALSMKMITFDQWLELEKKISAADEAQSALATKKYKSAAEQATLYRVILNAYRALQDAGIADKRIKNVEKLRELTRKLHEEILSDYDRQMAKASEVLNEQMAKVKTLSTGKSGAEQRAQKEATAAAMQQYNETTAKLTAKKQEAEGLKALTYQITAYETTNADKRIGKANDEFNLKYDAYKKLYEVGAIDPERYSELLADADKQRIADLQKENSLIKEQKQLIYENTRQALSARLRAIQGNPFLTDEQKAAQSIGPLSQEIALNSAYGQSPRENAGLQNQLLAAKGFGSFGYQFQTMAVGLKNEWGTLAMQMASSFKNVFGGAISSISSGLTGLIMHTKTWGQALAQIGTSIATSIVEAITQMGVRWIATQLLMAVAGKAILASATAATAPIAAALSLIWAVPATLATISSYGTAAAAAPGFIAAAEGVTLGMAAAGGIGSYAEGGRPIPGQLSLVGERGPELMVFDRPGTVIPADQTARMLASGPGANAGPAGSGAPVQTHIHFAGLFDSEKAALKALEGVKGQAFLLDFEKRTAHQILGRA